MKRAFNLFLLVTLLALAFGMQGVTPAQAAPITVLSSLATPATQSQSVPGKQAFGFTTPASGVYNLTSVQMDLAIDGICDITGSLYSDNAGVPGSALAAFTSIAAPNGSPSEMFLPSPYTLSPSTTYWFVLSDSCNSWTAFWGQEFSAAPSGIFTYNGSAYNTGGSWTFFGGHFVFAVNAELNAGEPAVGLSDTSLDFGDVVVGTTSAAQTVTVTNTGDADLDIGTLGITGEFALSNDTCSTATVSAGNNCTFDVTFQPLSLGPKSGSVSISSNAVTTPDSVALSGNGVAVPSSGTNLLKKPYFDNASLFPTPWRLFGVPYSKYGSVVDCNVYNTAPCSVLFPAGNRSAMQQVNLSGTAGDTYFFGLSSMAEDAGGKYLVEASIYSNFNKLLGRTMLSFTPGTHGWETLSGYVTATGNYNKVIFRFYYQNATGRAWFDDAFLIQVP